MRVWNKLQRSVCALLPVCQGCGRVYSQLSAGLHGPEGVFEAALGLGSLRAQLVEQQLVVSSPSATPKDSQTDTQETFVP